MSLVVAYLNKKNHETSDASSKRDETPEPTTTTTTKRRRTGLLVRKNAALEQVKQSSERAVEELEQGIHNLEEEAADDKKRKMAKVPLLSSVATGTTKESGGTGTGIAAMGTITKRKTAQDLQKELELVRQELMFVKQLNEELKQDKLELKKRCDGLQLQLEKERAKNDAKSDANYNALFNQHAAVTRHQAKMCETMTTGMVTTQTLKTMYATMRDIVKCKQPNDMIGYLNKTYDGNPLLAKGRLQELQMCLSNWKQITDKVPESQRGATIQSLDENAPQIIEVLETEHRIIQHAIDKASQQKS